MVWIDSLVTTFPADMKTISYHEVSPPFVYSTLSLNESASRWWHRGI